VSINHGLLVFNARPRYDHVRDWWTLHGVTSNAPTIVDEESDIDSSKRYWRIRF